MSVQPVGHTYRRAPAHRVGLTVPQAADLLGVSPYLVKRLLREGTLTRHKIGAATRLDRREVMALLGRTEDSGGAE